MFKKGQVWRSMRTGVLYVCVSCVKGYPPLFRKIGDSKRAKPIGHRQITLVGNNYQERKTARETHNLIQNLRRDNKELRRQNKDLRDDIGDMASKLHLANKRTLEVMTPHAKDFPGTAFKRWLSDITGDLPEQRGCRKEDC